MPASSATSPVTTLNSVVLPAPLGPISPTTSPGRDADPGAVEGDEPAEAHDDPGGHQVARRARPGRASGATLGAGRSAPAAAQPRRDVGVAEQAAGAEQHHGEQHAG